MIRFAQCTGTLLLIALVSTAAGGCRTMAKATGTYDVMLSADPDKVVEAVKGAMADLKITVTGATSTKIDGEVNGTTAQGDSITVKVRSEGEKVSRMTVKVGTLGDKMVSQNIIDGTKKRLE